MHSNGASFIKSSNRDRNGDNIHFKIDICLENTYVI